MKNNNHKKGNNKKPSYFKENVQRFGENFIASKTMHDLQRDAQRIIRDMVYGNIVFETEGKYLYNNELISACYNRANEVYIETLHISNGLQMLMERSDSKSGDFISIQNTYNKYRRKCDAYNMIRSNLYNFGVSGNTGYISGIVNQLKEYKSYI